MFEWYDEALLCQAFMQTSMKRQPSLLSEKENKILHLQRKIDCQRCLKEFFSALKQKYFGLLYFKLDILNKNTYNGFLYLELICKNLYVN